MDSPFQSIPTRSRRQAMDWSLALASQGIAAIINRGEAGWELLVDVPEYGRAIAVIKQYHIENRGWKWQRQVPGIDVVFHWGSLFWALAIAGFYYWSAVQFPRLKDAGMVDSQAVMRGQWWRLFTAVTLHENVPHLVSNAATGSLLLGLAMAYFGPGVALLAAFLAGVVGNCASVMLDPMAHQSLGASGMVTGALGLITVQTFADWRRHRAAGALVPRALAGGVLILVLISFSPGADVLAHVGGFLGGTVFGVALGAFGPEALRRRAVNVGSGILLCALIIVTWLLASRA